MDVRKLSCKHCGARVVEATWANWQGEQGWTFFFGCDRVVETDADEKITLDEGCPAKEVYND